jgi:Tfp pilus assembly protein PilO
MKRQMRRIRITGVLALGALASLLLLYVIGPRVEEPQRIQAQAAQVLQEKDAIEERILGLMGRAIDLDTAKEQLEYYNTRFPATTALPELQSAINAAADRSGLGSRQILSVSTTSPTPRVPAAAPASSTTETSESPDPSSSGAGGLNPDVWEMKVSIEATGSFTALSRFASALLDMDRTFVIDSVSISSSATGSAKVTIEARTFLLRDLSVEQLEALQTSQDVSR